MDTITPGIAEIYHNLFHDDTEDEDFNGFVSDEYEQDRDDLLELWRLLQCFN